MAGRREILLHLNTPFYPEGRPWVEKGAETLFSTRDLEPRGYLRAMAREARATLPDYGQDCELAAVWAGGLPCLGGMNCRGVALHLCDPTMGELLKTVEASGLAAGDGAPEVTLTAHPGRRAGTSMDLYSLGRVGRVWVDLATSCGREEQRLERFMEHDLSTGRRELLGRHLERGDVDLGAGLLLGAPGQTPREARGAVQACARFGATWISVDFLEAGPAGAEDKELDACAQAMEERLLAEGFAEYLPGQWALPGHESLFLQRLYEGCGYLGLGLGATSALDGMGVANTTDPTAYLARPDDPAATVARTWRL